MQLLVIQIYPLEQAEGPANTWENNNLLLFETNNTSHSRNDQHVQFEKPLMSPQCA